MGTIGGSATEDAIIKIAIKPAIISSQIQVGEDVSGKNLATHGQHMMLYTMIPLIGVGHTIGVEHQPIAFLELLFICQVHHAQAIGVSCAQKRGIGIGNEKIVNPGNGEFLPAKLFVILTGNALRRKITSRASDG